MTMKPLALVITFVLLISSLIYGQEKWTCYTDDKVLLMDDFRTLGVFEYVDGTLWIITDRGINIFDGKQWKKIDSKSNTMNKSISSYMVDSTNRVWVGSNQDVYYGPAFLHSFDDGVVIFDGNTWKSMRTKDMGFKAPVVTRMFETSNGDIWLAVSSVRSGVERSALFAKGALLRFSNDEWTVYKAKDFPCLSCEFVKGFYEDDNGRIFFTAAEGLFYFENEKFHEIKKDDGYNFRTFAPAFLLFDSKNNLWLGAPARIARYDGKSWRTFTRKNGLPSADWPPIGLRETSDNKIVMTARNGLFHFDGKDHWKHEKIKFLIGNSYIDKQNRIWLAGHKGLMIKDGDEIETHKELPKVWATIEDNAGGVWALSRNKGLKRYKGGNWELFNKNNKLPSDKIRSGFVAKDGTVWIGTTKGICSCKYN